MNNHCLCCDHTLLRHIRHGDLYWYCGHCRQEMPAGLSQSVSKSLRKLGTVALVTVPALLAR